MKRLLEILTRALVLLVAMAFSLPSFAEETIDWKQAQAIRKKVKNGEAITAKEEAYLKRAMEVRHAGKEHGNSETTGDGSGEKSTVATAKVSLEDSPVLTLATRASDGREIEVAYRVPPGTGPFPAYVFFHGGLGQRRLGELKSKAATNATHTRFLAAGNVSVSATFRTYAQDPLSRGPILDAIAIVEEVKKLPDVDPRRVVVFGGSGGGSLALELASEPKAAPLAVVAGEPASVIYTGIMSDNSMRTESMSRSAQLYSDDLRERTRKKIEAIQCPILIHHGDVHPLKKVNFEILIPEIVRAHKKVVVQKYPGEKHGFYWGNDTSLETVEAVVANTLKFVSSL